MIATELAEFADILDRVADVCPRVDIPDTAEDRAWLIGRVQVVQLELSGLEARLVNNTPQPKTPAVPKPPPSDPKPKGHRP